MDTDTAPISPQIESLHQYLKDRAIPLDPDFLGKAGITFAAGNTLSTTIGIPFADTQLGILIHYPGTDYATARLIPGGPRCPKGILPHTYFPHMRNWDLIEGTLVLCESPLKAITWAMMGYNAISAGGTTTLYMPRKEAWCEDFPHASIESGAVHTVLVAWDSDTEGMNANVSRDQRTLCRALSERHPDVQVLIHVLPAPPEEFGDDKWGCDDMHAFVGSEAFREFCGDTGLRREPHVDPMQKHMDELSEQYVVVTSTQKAYDLRNGNEYSHRGFVETVEPSRQLMVDTDKGPKVHKIAPLWWASAARPTVSRLGYSPGEEVIAGDSYNLWRPSSVIPRQGDVSPWLDLINDAVRDPEIRRLMLLCMAYQVQHRGERLEKLLYFAGRDQGTGKSTMANIMGKVLGDHNVGRPVKQSIESAFNEAWLARELAILDDIQKLHPSTWSKLKMLITADEVEINKKGVPEWKQRNHCVFYITANQADIITTDMDERRVLMIPWEPTTLHRDKDDPYWRGFHAWLANGGIDFIAYYLMHFDLATFDPDFHPPLTDAKRDAIESAVTDEESFIEDFRNNPTDFVPKHRQAITGHELFMLMSGEEPNPMNKHEQIAFAKMIGARMALRRVVPGQVKINYKNMPVYWVPGNVKDTFDMKAIRNNIKKFPVVLQSE